MTPVILHTTNTLYAFVVMLAARFPVSPCDPPNVNTLRLFKALLVSVGRSPPLAVTSFPLLLLSFQVSTSEPFSVMLAADESAPSNHKAGVAISSGLATATTGPASVVYSESEDEASSHRARPLIERGVNAVSRGRRRRGDMVIAAQTNW
jgi:hypothetical protein